MQVFGVSGGSVGGGPDSLTTIKEFTKQTGVTFPLLLNDRSHSKFAKPAGQDNISPYPIDVITDGQTIEYLRREFDGAAMRQKIEELLQR